MANKGPNKNGSQFLICFDKAPQLDEKHIVFGRVVQGYKYIEQMEKVQTANDNQPVEKIVIVNAGELKGEDKIDENRDNDLKIYY